MFKKEKRSAGHLRSFWLLDDDSVEGKEGRKDFQG